MIIYLSGPITGHEQYMEIAFAMLEASDVIWMLPGWRDSKGACMEYGFARFCGMEIWGA